MEGASLRRERPVLTLAIVSADADRLDVGVSPEPFLHEFVTHEAAVPELDEKLLFGGIV